MANIIDLLGEFQHLQFTSHSKKLNIDSIKKDLDGIIDLLQVANATRDSEGVVSQCIDSLKYLSDKLESVSEHERP